jgi:6-phosphogluconolactonase
MIVESPAELAHVFVRRLMDAIALARAEARRLSVALPGGSVAEAFFPVLAGQPIDWSVVELFWGDERAVPWSHADSNYRLAHDLLLNRIQISPTQVHAMPASAEDLDRAAREYERDLIRTLGEAKHVDVALLGLGSDGHVCSLFPDHRALAEHEHLVVPIVDSPKPPPRRLTLTLPPLSGADVYVVGFGAAKAGAIRSSISVTSMLPAAQALRGARRAVVLADTDAASLVVSGFSRTDSALRSD